MSTETEKMHFGWSSVEAFGHSAKASPGNSGGPVIEMATGKVIGINFTGNSANDQNYAISGNVAQDYVNRMIKGENIHSIGIFPEVMLNSNNFSIGVKVNEVTAGKKASKIGIIKNDLIVELGGNTLRGFNKDVKTLERYCNVLDTLNPNNHEDPDDIGDVIPIKIYRDVLDSNDNKYLMSVRCEGEINGRKLMLSGMFDHSGKKWIDLPASSTCASVHIIQN